VNKNQLIHGYSRQYDSALNNQRTGSRIAIMTELRSHVDYDLKFGDVGKHTPWEVHATV
jgi:hypothetical protein